MLVLLRRPGVALLCAALACPRPSEEYRGGSGVKVTNGPIFFSSSFACCLAASPLLVSCRSSSICSKLLITNQTSAAGPPGPRCSQVMPSSPHLTGRAGGKPDLTYHRAPPRHSPADLLERCKGHSAAPAPCWPGHAAHSRSRSKTK